jgi:hypothetical protein
MKRVTEYDGVSIFELIRSQSVCGSPGFRLISFHLISMHLAWSHKGGVHEAGAGLSPEEMVTGCVSHYSMILGVDSVLATVGKSSNIIF